MKNKFKTIFIKKTIFIIYIIFIVKINLLGDINLNNINDRFNRENVNIKKIKEENLVNNGFLKIYRKNIFKGASNIYGGDCKFLRVNDSGFLMTTVKIIGSEQENSYIYFRNYKIGVYRIDDKGKLKWNVVFGYKGMKSNICKDIIRTNDNSYMFLVDVIKDSFSEKKHYIGIVKIDNRGKIEWKKIWGNKNKIKESLEGIKILRLENGYIILGNVRRWGTVIDRKSYILKLDNNGNKMWDKETNYSASSGYKSIIDGYINFEGKLIILADSGRKNEFLFYKINLKNGEIEKNYIFEINDITNKYWIYDANIIDDNNMNKFIAGEMVNNINKIFILKVNKSMAYKWLKIFSNGNNNILYGGIVNNKNSFILYGKLDYNLKSYNDDIFLLEVDKEGDVQYMQIFSIGNFWNEIRGMEINEKGELIGLFEWSNKKDGKIEDYITIDKIEIR